MSLLYFIVNFDCLNENDVFTSVTEVVVSQCILSRCIGVL